MSDDFKQWLQTQQRKGWDGWTSQTLQRAMDGDREGALEMWREVASHPHSIESILWVQAVAERLLNADRQRDRRRRPDAILKAVGFAGREDRHRALREKIDVIRSFDNLDRKLPPQRGEESQALYNYVRTLSEFEDFLRELPSFKKFARNGGTIAQFKDDLTNDEIRKFVDRIQKK